MAEADPYDVERAKRAAQREQNLARQQLTVRAVTPEQARLEAIADKEVRQIGARACRELRAGGIPPARFIREGHKFWSGDRVARPVRLSSSYWAIEVHLATVLVNEDGMYWGGQQTLDSPSQKPTVWYEPVTRIEVGETYYFDVGGWYDRFRPFCVNAGPLGHAMVSSERLATAVAESVVGVVEAARGD